MKLIASLLRLIRFTNLVMIAFSMYLIRYMVVLPFLQESQAASALSGFQFNLLTLAVVLVAAGGYVINNFYDTGIDALNKPGSNPVGTLIPRKMSLLLYMLLTLGGIVAAILFGESTGIRYAVLVVGMAAGLLYFYSSSYKKMLLAGNIIIALLAALNIFITILFDKTALLSMAVLSVVTAYTIFAFLLTLSREIIKDCEDAAGDRAFGANTLPVAAGMKTARIIAAIITSITAGVLGYIQIITEQWDDVISFSYVTLFLQLPLLSLSFLTATSNKEKSDHRNSTIAKWIMVAGLCSMIVFYLSFN